MANGLNFNGSSSYVTVGNPVPYLTSFTIEVRLKQTTAVTAGNNNYHAIVKIGDNYSFNFRGYVAAAANSFGTHQRGVAQVGTNESLPINTDYLLSVTQSTLTMNTINTLLYCNGVMKDNTVGYAAGAINLSTGVIYLGLNMSYQAFIGNISEVRIWNYPRTPEQIAIFNQCRLNGNEDGLIYYATFEEGTGATLVDRSDNRNNGIITNGTWVSTSPNLPLSSRIRVGGVV